MLIFASHLTKQLVLMSVFSCLCAINYAQDRSLFKTFIGELNTSQLELVNNIESLHSTKRTRIATIQKSVFGRNEIVANLFADHNPRFQPGDIGIVSSNYGSWTGVSQDDLGSAAVIINGDRISAHFTSLAGSFEIIPLDTKGTHLIIEHDMSEYGTCGNSDEAPRIKDDIEDSTEPIFQIEKGFPQRMPGASECRIRLLVAYTPDAQANTLATYNRTMIEHIELAILQMNQGYANSLAEQRVELAYLYKTTDVETGDPTNDLNDLRDTADGKWDEIHELRDLHNADMVALITDGNYEGLCGKAYGFDYELENNMFQITEYNCAVSNFTLAHEFGHLQGCRHNVDPNDTPFPFGHGFSQGGVFQTIMAVCCGGVKVNYWSNPYVFYPGVGSMGTLNFNYNASALNISDSTVAHHRLTPPDIDSGVMLGDDHLVNGTTPGLLIATDTTMNGGCLILQSEVKVRLAAGFHSYDGSHGNFRIASGCAESSELISVANNTSLQRDSPPVAYSANNRDQSSQMPGTSALTRDKRK